MDLGRSGTDGPFEPGVAERTGGEITFFGHLYSLRLSGCPFVAPSDGGRDRRVWRGRTGGAITFFGHLYSLRVSGCPFVAPSDGGRDRARGAWLQADRVVASPDGGATPPRHLQAG